MLFLSHLEPSAGETFGSGKSRLEKWEIPDGFPHNLDETTFWKCWKNGLRNPRSARKLTMNWCKWEVANPRLMAFGLRNHRAIGEAIYHVVINMASGEIPCLYNGFSIQLHIQSKLPKATCLTTLRSTLVYGFNHRYLSVGESPPRDFTWGLGIRPWPIADHIRPFVCCLWEIWFPLSNLCVTSIAWSYFLISLVESWNVSKKLIHRLPSGNLT